MIKTAQAGRRFAPGELRKALIAELLKYPEGDWVKGADLRRALGTESSLGGVMGTVQGLVEGQMGRGYRLTPRGRRLAISGMIPEHNR